MNTERFSATHLPAVAALEKEIFAGRDPWREEAFARELESPMSIWLLAFVERELAGYAGGWVVGEEFHLLNLGVSPRMRRQGIGRRLLSDILSRALEKKCTMALLDVRRSNVEARSLYEKAGFAERAVRPGYYSNGEDALLYSMALVGGGNETST